MLVLKTFARYWLPLVTWMTMIFVVSADQESAQHSSRILEPLLRWLFPKLTPEQVGPVVFAIRKLAHSTEYAVLAALSWRAMRRPVRDDPRPWRWSHAFFALLLTVGYAASDEFHQSFVPTRTGTVWDVVIDSGGAMLGLAAVWLWGRVKRRW
ncbi:MAG: VanZ family protein [Verrucomicrobia bacterium]|nr:VanZ family protein [Verrucomicrobiota bacterium]